MLIYGHFLLRHGIIRRGFAADKVFYPFITDMRCVVTTNMQCQPHHSDKMQKAQSNTAGYFSPSCCLILVTFRLKWKWHNHTKEVASFSTFPHRRITISPTKLLHSKDHIVVMKWTLENFLTSWKKIIQVIVWHRVSYGKMSIIPFRWQQYHHQFISLYDKTKAKTKEYAQSFRNNCFLAMENFGYLTCLKFKTGSSLTYQSCGYAPILWANIYHPREL